MTTDRIKTMRHVTAMVALDTVPLLAERVINLLSHGRRITTTYRVTCTNATPEVTTGQTLDGEVNHWHHASSAGIGVHLKPGLTGGFGFHAGEGDTEAEEWKRYHAAEQDRDRKCMTLVEITGGLPGDGPAADDRIVIRHWNSNGVCVEKVVAFDYGTGRGFVVLEVDEKGRPTSTATEVYGSVAEAAGARIELEGEAAEDGRNEWYRVYGLVEVEDQR